MKKWSVVVALALLLTACGQDEDRGAEGNGAGAGSPASGSGADGRADSGDAPAGNAGAGEAAPDGEPAGGDGGAEEASLEVVADGLHSPWAIAPAPDGSIYISERDGAIVRVGADGAVEREAVRLAKPVHQAGESGFLGLALLPDFAASGRAYAYHSYREDGVTKNRVVVLERADGAWEEREALLEDIPGGTIHNGGRLKLGPDGMLYVTTGDAGNERLAQDLSSLAGKILRLAPDGAVPADNPLAGSYVYSYGHRNSQGIGWDGSGTMFAVEHGPSSVPRGHDELNRIEPGANYGWPAIIGDERADGMKAPLYHSGDESIAPSGMAVAASGDIYAAGLVGERLFRFSPAGELLEIALEGEGRLRDVVAADGALYVITNNTDGRGKPGGRDDRLIRLHGEW